MKVSSFARAFGRRTVVLLSAAAVLGVAVSAFAQAAPAAPADGQAAPAPAAQADPFKFSTDAGMVIWYVKPDKTADFESVWTTLKAKLAASADADQQALGASMHFYRLAGAPTADGAMYLFIMDPASKTLSYGPSPYLLFQSKLFPDPDARALFDKLSAAISRISPSPLDKVQ